MNTNKKEFNKVFKQYVIDGIKYTADDLANDATDADVFKYALNRFEVEYNTEYHKYAYPSVHTRFINYLQGLPFGFAVYYNEILDDYKKLLIDSGLKKEGFKLTDKEENYLIDNYYHNIAKVILKQSR